MRAVLCNAFTGPEDLRIGEVEEPKPAGDEILIDVHAASVSFMDNLIVSGLYQMRPPTPFVPGTEAAGSLLQRVPMLLPRIFGSPAGRERRNESRAMQRVHRAGGPAHRRDRGAEAGQRRDSDRRHAASVSFMDHLLVSGLYQMRPPTPFVPGTEAAGVVIAVGGKVTRFRPGDRVACGSWTGGYAERMIAKEWKSVRLPAGVAFETAATVLHNYGTAYYALVEGHARNTVKRVSSSSRLAKRSRNFSRAIAWRAEAGRAAMPSGWSPRN